MRPKAEEKNDAKELTLKNGNELFKGTKWAINTFKMWIFLIRTANVADESIIIILFMMKNCILK